MRDRDPIAALHNGDVVMMIDDSATEGGAELWLAAENAESAAMGLLVRQTTGFVTVAIAPARAAQLELPAMWYVDPFAMGQRPIQTVTCDAAEGITTGISAADRALTARVLGSSTAGPDDLRRPGHMVPLRVPGGLSAEATPAHAALTMSALAGLQPAMVRCELVRDSGELATASYGLALAAGLGIAVVEMSELTESASVGGAHDADGTTCSVCSRHSDIRHTRRVPMRRVLTGPVR